MMLRHLIVFVLIGFALWPGIPPRADTHASHVGVSFSQTVDIEQPPVIAPGISIDSETVPQEPAGSHTTWLPGLGSPRNRYLVGIGWLLLLLGSYFLVADLKKRSR